MKKITLTLLILLAAFSAKAQQMNFEETVKYINDKIECCSVFKSNKITATPQGQIKWDDKQVNLFDLVPAEISIGIIAQNNGIGLLAL